MILTAFHGTVTLFPNFRWDLAGLHFGTLEQAAHRCTILSGHLPLRAYEKLPLMEGGQPGFIAQVTLRVVQSRRLADQRTRRAWIRAIQSAQADGFDALVYRNDYECPYQQADSWVVFRPDQILSMEFPFNRAEDLSFAAK